jgi:uncharacterized protein (UPF0548 family)
MSIFFFKPSPTQIAKLHQKQKDEVWNYSEQAATQNLNFPKGYNHDRYKCYLGEGDEAWQAAKAALSNWKMFPKWTSIYPSNAAQTLGQEVLVTVKLAPLYWLNGARVVYTLDEDQRFGFAYGTLKSHAERGEELFMVSRNENGEVFFELQAFSQPFHPLAKIGKPLVRRLQKQFAKDAQTAMQQAVR